jgi:hypothetical protein
MTTTTDATTLDVTVSALVRRPVSTVAAHAAHPETAASWLPHALGRRLPLGFSVVSYDADSTLVLRTGQGPFRLEATYSWEPNGTWTRLTLRSRGDAPRAGLASMAAPLLHRAVTKAMERDMARLVGSIESAG